MKGWLRKLFSRVHPAEVEQAPPPSRVSAKEQERQQREYLNFLTYDGTEQRDIP